MKEGLESPFISVIHDHCYYDVYILQLIRNSAIQYTVL